MEQTRRGLLRAGAAGVVGGIGGCLEVQGVEYPDAPPETDEPTDSGSESDGPEDTPVRNAILADATRAVVDDVVWFASTYDTAIDTYLDATGDVLETVNAIRNRVRHPTDPSTAMIARLENVGHGAAERAKEVLEPHFFPEELLRSRTDRHLPALRRSAERSDADRFVEELDRMSGSFSRIRTPLFVGGTFSRAPIHNRLLDRLAPDAPDRVLVELAVPDRRRFATVAHRPYEDDDTVAPTFTGEPFPEARREALRDRLGPVVQPEARDEELFVTFIDRPASTDNAVDAFRGTYGDLDGTSVHVQRYTDVDAASARLEGILEVGSTEGREPINPGAPAVDDDAESDDNTVGWHRYYHREARSDRTDLDNFPGVQYGYVVRAGEFLLATGFSGDSWEERPRWQGRLADGWVTA